MCAASLDRDGALLDSGLCASNACADRPNGEFVVATKLSSLRSGDRITLAGAGLNSASFTLRSDARVEVGDDWVKYAVFGGTTHAGMTA